MRARGGGTGRSAEMVSLAERMGYLQGLRAGFAVAAVAAALAFPGFVGLSLREVTMVSIAYFVLTALIEAVRRIGGGRHLYAVAGMLLADGVYLAWIMYLTGFVQSPLRFMLYLHLIAVTLLASYRTGLKIALWHSLLFFVVFHAQLAGLLDPRGPSLYTPGIDGLVEYRPSIFNVTAFWVVALGTAVFSFVNERELRRRKNDLEALNEMGVEFESLSDPHKVAESYLTRVCDALGFRRGLVVAGPRGALKVLAAKGADGAGETVPDDCGLLLEVEQRRETIVVSDLDPGTDGIIASLLPGARNLLVTPLVADGNQLGVLVVEQRRRGHRLERRVLSTIGQFTSHAALALRNAWLLEEVRQMADTDGLTGLANRRSFEAALDREVARALRTGEQLTLVLLDIDYFKDLNDRHGHQVGDRVLRATGRALRAASREFDTAARYGGEEFVVLLPGCSSDQAVAAAERLRAAVAGIEDRVAVTASAGVATLPLNATDSAGLVRAADRALYDSKSRGRDVTTRSFARPPAPAAAPVSSGV
ncbi:MAG TPA: sensor domain-containing diguanylate cyclase [Actinomycetota bacterium]|nr:sensor domain-containing diguanylate cyclase [Actinomycetota bacterium]